MARKSGKSDKIPNLKQMPSATGLANRGKGLPRRLFKAVIGFGVVVVLAFLILPLIYALPFVRPVSTLMAYDQLTGQPVQREWRSIGDMAPALAHSVIMSEDGQFCRHRGVDWGELKAVIDDAMDGETPRGASTITMQLAKNLLLWPSRSVLRKAVEIPLAVYLDLVLSKKRLMEIYLNVVEWGPGVYGAAAAAQYHFGTDAAKLTRRQAAYLAVTLPNPIARTPAKPTKGLSRLARLIEERARKAGGHVECLGSDKA